MYTALSDSVDQFEQYYENMKKLEAQITQNIQLKTKRLQQDESVLQVEREMRQQLAEFQKNLQQMQGVVKDLSSTTTSQELQRRRNIATELLNRYTQMNTKMMENEMKNKYKSVLQSTRTVKDETQLTKTNVELQQMQRDVYGRQEEQVDNLIDTIDRLGNHTKQIGRALDEDKVVMAKLNTKVGSTSHDLKAAETRLNDFLSRTSNCCLWTIIMVELMIFIMLIIY